MGNKLEIYKFETTRDLIYEVLEVFVKVIYIEGLEMK
jgi:hypothetical protein